MTETFIARFCIIQTTREKDNSDHVDTFLTARNLDLAEALVIVISKDFTSATLNARSARHWLLQHLTI
jgi:glucose-6-phosphate isomerase